MNNERIQVGYVEASSNILAPNLVYNTGNQTIAGVKIFATEIIAPNLVYNTGDQNINGNKTFFDNVNITGGSSKLFTLNTNLNLNVDELSFTGVNVTLIDGSVGIGTNTPIEKLEVDGNMRLKNGFGIFDNIILESRGWPQSHEIEIVVQNFQDLQNFQKEVIATPMGNYGYIDALFGVGPNGGLGGDKFIFYETGKSNNIPYSNGPYLRLGPNNVISEKNNSKLGIGILNPIQKVHISGGNLRVEKAIVDLGDSELINAVPRIVNETTNFIISGDDNGRIILANSATQITGTIVSGNVTGFNTSIIQIGAGQIQITGSGAGVVINSYNNQYKTAGSFATISLLHTGNNGYIMYGNTI